MIIKNFHKSVDILLSKSYLSIPENMNYRHDFALYFPQATMPNIL